MQYREYVFPSYKKVEQYINFSAPFFFHFSLYPRDPYTHQYDEFFLILFYSFIILYFVDNPIVI